MKKLSIALVVALILSAIIFTFSSCGGGGGGNVPVYTGMSISSTKTGASATASGGISDLHPLAGTNNGNGNNGDNGNHYGQFKGDHEDKNNEIDNDNPFPENSSNENIENELESSLNIVGSAKEIYYAKPNEDIYIVIHIDNPDNYEILSFTLNGKKYSDYMFEAGSDMENIILKYNVGNAEGVVEYTIDAIKYVDGTDIKDVRMDGDRTVKAGIRSNKRVTASISNLDIETNKISFKIKVTDELNLVALSGGKLLCGVYDGANIVSSKLITVGETEVSFDGLKTNTLYQFGAIAYYDNLAGQGMTTELLCMQAKYTEAIVLFKDISVGKEDITFGFDWHEDRTDKSLTSLKLYQGNELVSDLGIDATSANGLLSGKAYYLIAEYTNGSETESIRLDFTTQAKTVPNMQITVSEKTQTSLGFSLAEVDPDDICEITSVEFIKGTDVISNMGTELQGTFANLLSDNTYKVKVIYKYNLNDGNGEQIGTKVFNIATEAKTIPQFEFTNASSQNGIFTFEWNLVDPDSITTVKSIKIYNENTLISELDITSGIEFEMPDVKKKYVAKIAYEYDLNDGVGVQVSETSFDSWIPSQGLEIVNGKIVGIGECTDTTLYINLPVDMGAFDGNKTIENVYLLEGVTYIERYAFRECSKLQYVYIGDGVGTFSDNVFTNSDHLESVYISASIESISYNMFSDCTKLSEVVFEEGSQLKTIGEWSFSHCTSLKSIEIPDSVTSISTYAFYFSGLQAVKFGENSSLTLIDERAFSHCMKLTSFDVPSSVTEIKREAFFYCNSLGAIAIPGTVTTIGSDVFVGCSKVAIFTDASESPSGWSETMAPDEQPVFFNAQKNTYTFVTNGGSAINSVTNYAIGSAPVPTRDGYVFVGWYDNVELNGSAVTFPYYNGEKTTLYAKWFDLEVASLSQGLKIEDGIITGIGTCKDKVLYITNPVGYEAFKDNHTIEKVYLLNGCTYVGGNAFQGCSKLQYVYIGDNVENIYHNSFGKCSNLREVYIGASVKAIEGSFENCTKLSKVEFAENSKMTDIYGWSFSGCTSLKTIRIPDSVTTIDQYAFQSSGLVSVYFGENTQITTIKEGAFNNCYNLTSFNVPETVAAIGARAFDWCSSLKAVVIPGTVGSVGDNAFEGCYELTIYTDASELPDGWSEAMNPSNRPVVFNAEKNTYTFVTNGGSAVNDITYYLLGSAPVSLKDGYVIVGWYDNPEFNGSPVSFPYRNAQKTTLYAKWMNEYTFVTNGGTEVTNGKESTVFAEPLTVKDGFVFAGWYDNAEFNGSPVTFPYFNEEKTVLYARWMDGYSFVTNGGTVVENIYQSILSTSPVTTKDGFVFTGWYDNADFNGGAITFPYHNAENTTLYAKWFDLQGASVSTGFTMENGEIIDIGTCEDTVLYITHPIRDNAFKDNNKIEKVYLLNGCTYIGGNSFSGCSKLEYVYIGEGVERIGWNAFNSCAALEEVYISSSVEDLGLYTFQNCISLKKVTFEEESRITQFGDRIFNDCSSLESIKIPDSVTFIEYMNFAGCVNLKTVEFGENSKLVRLGADVFNGCRSLESIELPNGIAVLESGTFVGCSSLKTAVLPGELTTIRHGAFNGCSSLTSILIPESVNTINSNAFFGCEGLIILMEAAELPNALDPGWNPLDRPVVLDAKKNTYSFVTNGGTAIDSINDYAIGVTPLSTKDGYFLLGWYDNAELEGAPVKFPYYNEEKTTLYAKWFDLQGASISTGFTMENGVITGIGTCEDTVLYITHPVRYEAFKDNHKIEKVYLLNGCTDIGSYAFSGCTKLNYVYIGDGVERIEHVAFGSCSRLESVYIGSTINWMSSSIFDQCTKLSSVEFGEDFSLTELPGSIFSGCTSLKNITIPDCIETIGECAFQGSGIVSVEFGENSKLTKINQHAFDSCRNLVSFIIPESVEVIGKNAFRGSDNLKSVVIPGTVASIGDNAFQYCYSLTIFTNISELSDGWSEAMNPDNRPVVFNAEKSTYTFVTNGGSAVNSINDYLIGIAPLITKDGYILIGWYDNAEFNGDPVGFPYYNGENTTLYARWMNEYTFVTNGGTAVSNGKDATISQSPVTTKDGFVFSGWYDNADFNGGAITFPYHNAEKTTLYAKWFDLQGASISTGFTMENGVITGMGTCNDTVLYITHPVRYEAFKDNYKIEKVYLLNGCTYVDSNAFNGCTKLNYVYIGDGVERIEYSAFSSCARLESVYIGSTINWMNSSIFSQCTKLSSVEFGEGFSLTEIPAWTFSGCTSLKNITIPDCIETIGEYAFQSSGIESVEFGENSKLTTIKEGAFSNCNYLTGFSVPETVEVIGKNAFNWCYSLKSIGIPGTVEAIGNYAFDGCYELTIYTDASELPDGWSETMNPDNRPVVFNAEKSTYTFVTNGGTAIDPVNDYIVCEPPVPVKDGYILVGWYDNAEFNGDPVVFPYRNAQDATLYAKWMNEYTFVTNGGTAVSNGKDATISESPITTKNGYILVGWYDNGEFNGDPVVFPYYNEEKTTLYAKWMNEYTFITNGGTAVANGKDAVIQTSPVTTRDGYVFSGWYDNPELSGGAIKFPYSNSEKTTLYAKWFDLQGASISTGFTMEDGVITGMGTCEDTVLYITHPVRYQAFMGNTKIEKVYFLNGCTDIGSNAFDGCSKLDYVYIGEGVENISFGAFQNCSKLEEAYISSTIDILGERAFNGCSALSKVEFAEGSRLTEIPRWTFYFCRALKTVNIPDNVTTICEDAFGNSGIETISFGKNSRLTTIETRAFNCCESLIKFNVPETVNSIGYGAFVWNNELKYVFIPSTVDNIDASAFNGCYKLIIFTDASEIPSGWSDEFKPAEIPVILNATKQTYTFATNGGSAVNSIVDYAISTLPVPTKDGYIFVDWYDNAEFNGDPVRCPYYSDEKMTLYAKWMDEYSFVTNGGTPIANIKENEIQTAPVTTKDGYYLAGWYDNPEFNGTPVRFPYYNEEKTTLYAKWFDLQGASISTGFTMENGVITGMGTCTDTVLYITHPVGYEAFKENHRIEKIYLLNGCTYVEGNAFYGCTKLNYVYIGEGVEDIRGAFNNCTKLEEVYIGSTLQFMSGDFSGCSKLSNVEFAEYSSLRRIGGYAFSGCTSLKTVTIPDSVTIIQAFAFYNSGIESIEFGGNSQLTEIYEYAFSDCYSLKDIDIPSYVVKIGDYAFNGCSSLKSIFISETVDSVDSNAFNQCDSLTIFTDASEIPMGWSALFNPGERPVIFNAEKRTYTFVTNGGSVVDSITDYAVSIAPVTLKDGYIFTGWYDNEEFEGNPVSFPYYDEEKTTLYAKWIDKSVVTSSEGLTIENGVITGIGSCTDTVLFINAPVADGAFANCNNIETVYFGSGVTSIGNQAFSNCSNLKTVYFECEDIPQIGSDVFGGTWDASDFMIYVPMTDLDDYKNVSDSYWQGSIVSSNKISVIG